MYSQATWLLITMHKVPIATVVRIIAMYIYVCLIKFFKFYMIKLRYKTMSVCAWHTSDSQAKCELQVQNMSDSLVKYV